MGRRLSWTSAATLGARRAPSASRPARQAACGEAVTGPPPGRWYTLLALAHGCRVVAIDAGADHLANLNMSLALNGWLDRARLYHGVASGEREVSFNGWHAETPSGEQAHGYSDRDLNGRGKSYASQTPLALDDVVDEEVAYLKVDVESHEPSVFRSARKLLERRLVKYLLFEWTYHIGGNYHFSAYADDVLGPLFASGYRCFFAEAGEHLRVEISAETLALAIKRLHAHCARSLPEMASHQRWCIINVVCARDDQQAPLDAPLITEA
jgi:FkbM family methyltransferase